PAQLERFGLTLSDVMDAVKTNNASAGGSVMPRGSMSFVIRGRGTLQDAREIGNIFIKSIGGTPVYLRDIATIGIDARLPSGIFSKDNVDEAVEGIVLMRRGENPSTVLEKVEAAVTELNHEGQLQGAQIVPFYDRSYLVHNTLHTVAHSVGLGI